MTSFSKGVTAIPFLSFTFSVYQYWSKNRHIHFGYYRWGMNPFRLEPMLEAMNDFVAGQLAISSSVPSRILDMGCGYGATIRQLLSKFPKANFIGISKNRGQIGFANEWLSRHGSLGKHEFRVADFEATGLPDASFDAVFALESACFAEGDAKKAFVAEAARLLCEGGSFVVLDGFRRSNAPLPYPVAWLYRNCLKAWRMRSLGLLPAFVQTLENQGFVEVKTRELSWNMAPSLLHIPWGCLKLVVVFFTQKDHEALGYAKALLLTLLLSPFKRYFGYYAVTCRKSSVRLEN